MRELKITEKELGIHLRNNIMNTKEEKENQINQLDGWYRHFFSIIPEKEKANVAAFLGLNKKKKTDNASN